VLKSALTGTIIAYKGTGPGPVLQAAEQLYGITIENLCIDIDPSSNAHEGIDIRHGGNNGVYRNLFINGPSTTLQGIYLRGWNPDTQTANGHQHRNLFENITCSGVRVGIRLGDDVPDGEANANLIILFNEGAPDVPGAYGLEINGYGTTIVHPILSNKGIRFFGRGSENSIHGGYVDSTVPLAVQLDSDRTESYVFTAYGTYNLKATNVVDSVAGFPFRTRFVIDGRKSRYESLPFLLLTIAIAAGSIGFQLSSRFRERRLHSNQLNVMKAY
jgi:hypothetical protein